MDTFARFPVTIFSNLETYNEVLSKARCRIFYKYGNRNGAYITDSFAETLIKSLPYTPVKGIYDNFNEDYTDHGKSRDLGRIYGVVPENPNIEWEDHVDEDGVTRTYCCADVLLFTSLYEEAKEIVGKSQSMELYAPAIQGDWQFINGKRWYVYTGGCFLGLQVLGDETTPCFEGSSFYSLYDSLTQIVNAIENYNLSLQNTNNGGQKHMDKIIFKLSDSAKHDALWSLLNDSYNEEGGWMVTYAICDVYDEYAIAFNYEQSVYERIYYTKNEDDSVSLGDKVRCFIVDVTESEKVTLDTIQRINGGSFTAAEEVYTKVDELNSQVEELNTKIGEYTTQLEEVTTEKANFEQKIEELNGSISTLTTENEKVTSEFSALQEEVEALRTFKLEAEKLEKEAVIAKYSKKISDEVLNGYSEKLVEFTAAELDKELAYEMVKGNPSIFSLEPQKPQYIPKDEGTKGGIEEILSKYTKMEE
jgi:outer membrane murein-binding lipoprotein Lpp